jgi:hypothetical protein
MFEMELHDWLAYLMSIGMICSLAAALASHWHAGVQALPAASADYGGYAQPMLPAVVRTEPVRHWLVHKVKRKEAPDDEDDACATSFDDEISSNEEAVYVPIHSNGPAPRTPCAFRFWRQRLPPSCCSAVADL